MGRYDGEGGAREGRGERRTIVDDEIKIGEATLKALRDHREGLASFADSCRNPGTVSAIADITRLSGLSEPCKRWRCRHRARAPGKPVVHKKQVRRKGLQAGLRDQHGRALRSEERRVGKEWVRSCRSRGS